MLKKWLKKRKDKEDYEYRMYRTAIIFQDCVHWLTPFFPVMEEVEKLMKLDAVMSMGRRDQIMERCGVGGISLAQLICLNETIMRFLAAESGWSTCQLKGDIIAPIAFDGSIKKLFVTDVYRQRMSIPEITIYVAQSKDIPIIEKAIDRFKRDTRIFCNPVINPRILLVTRNDGQDEPFDVKVLEKTTLPRIRILN